MFQGQSSHYAGKTSKARLKNTEKRALKEGNTNNPVLFGIGINEL